MGVTSSSRSGRGCHFDPSWYDGRFNEYGNLQVRSKRVSAFFGVHHFFLDLKFLGVILLMVQMLIQNGWFLNGWMMVKNSMHVMDSGQIIA